MMHTFLKKDSLDSWNTLPPVPTEKIINVNCHKFVLCELGKITWDNMVSESRDEDFTFGEKIRGISDLSYRHITTLESLLSLAGEVCNVGKIYIGQIRDSQTGEMAHSFIVDVQQNNHYVCFDKPGFKYPFQVSNLEEIWGFVNKDGERSNQNQEWRFIPIEEVR